MGHLTRVLCNQKNKATSQCLQINKPIQSKESGEPHLHGELWQGDNQSLEEMHESHLHVSQTPPS